MKHHLFVWGTNPQPFRGKADSSIVLPISVEEMARIGIPARKIPRVREELQRLIAACRTRGQQIHCKLGYGFAVRKGTVLGWYNP